MAGVNTRCGAAVAPLGFDGVACAGAVVAVAVAVAVAVVVAVRGALGFAVFAQAGDCRPSAALATRSNAKKTPAATLMRVGVKKSGIPGPSERSLRPCIRDQPWREFGKWQVN